MKKNEELKHFDKTRLTKKNYIIIILPIILILLLATFIACYVFIISNPSHKLKKILIEEGYTCNKQSCIKELNSTNYTIDYKKFIMSLENDEYRIQIEYNNTPILELKNNEFICSFSKSDYEKLTHVDNSFSYNKQCDKFVQDINKNIDYFKELLDKSNIDVNKIEK